MYIYIERERERGGGGRVRERERERERERAREEGFGEERECVRKREKGNVNEFSRKDRGRSMKNMKCTTMMFLISLTIRQSLKSFKRWDRGIQSEYN